MQARLQFSRPVSDDEILRLSHENAGWQFERDGAGALALRPPTGSSGDARNAILTAQLVAYSTRYGGKAFGSSGGFTMPNDALYSPDGAWIAEGRYSALTLDERESFAPIVPDVWIELRSKTDVRAELRHKLRPHRGSPSISLQSATHSGARGISFHRRWRTLRRLAVTNASIMKIFT